jgi:hypothetical protein
LTDEITHHPDIEEVIKDVADFKRTPTVTKKGVYELKSGLGFFIISFITNVTSGTIVSLSCRFFFFVNRVLGRVQRVLPPLHP